MNFKILIKQLINTPTRVNLTIKGKPRQIKAVRHFITINLPESEYLKVMMRDGSFLMILLKEEEVYYADSLIVKAKGIPAEMIGKKMLIYNGNKYCLVNPNDYQYVLHTYFGKICDIEDEVRFYDYSPLNKTKEILSLGWESYNGKRADIHCKLLSLSEIDIR